MDEPLSALDKKLREQMQIELKQLHRQLGVTTVYVTHDQREALTMSDRIAVINEGEIAQIGSPKQIYNNPSTTFVADFIGESSFLPLDRDGSNNLLFSGNKVTTISTNQKNKKWSLVIRPERLSIITNKVKKTRDKIYFSGKISELVFQGETALALIVLTNNSTLSLRFSTRSSDNLGELSVGQNISLSLDKKDTIIIPGGRDNFG